MDEHSALLVVDVQVDFCPGGSLGVPGGDTIIPIINRYIIIFGRLGVPVLATRDWHPPVTTHFRQFGGIWPPHCVQNSEGSRFHPALKLPGDAIIVSKGMDPDKDDYSAFHARDGEGTLLADILERKGIRHLYISGLATDYCVRQTSKDALSMGFEVTVLIDAVRGVDLTPGDSARALEEIVAAGGRLENLAAIEKASKT